ncbi:glycosyltransferase family 4 protein [Asticcacaulis taihuensis]|jgi:glycosyltransferase involved in cell wall biosynthesis|uniref:glycosyltransferase family 4 protein n=1 Tax=Asticcacaulis taihuensis TaxID=260084 RepID=UPI0026EB8BC4|nr:glycosyltransferase family 4 protein [Asticcacaulis taihuensis]
MPKPTFTATVLQVVPELDTGGVEQTVVDISEAIIAAGGRSMVATKGGRLEERLLKKGATVIHMPVHSKNPFVQWQNKSTLRRLIRAEKVDIVHVRSRAPAMAAIGAAKAEGIRSVATYAGIYNAKSGLKRWYNSQMTRADMIIANSDFTRAHILKTYAGLSPDKVISIPRGIDMKRFDPEAFDVRKIMKMEESWGVLSGDGRIRFLLAGRLTKWKGQALVVEAANMLRHEDIDNFMIIMVGDDQGRSEYTKTLKDSIHKYGLEERIKLVGHCDDMPSAYTACHYALAPSLEPEAFGRTAVEPQAMQRPPLAASHGATVETVLPGETGWLVKPGDAHAWADAMKVAIALPEEDRFEMGHQGREHVREQYGLPLMCQRTLDIYRSLLT